MRLEDDIGDSAYWPLLDPTWIVQDPRPKAIGSEAVAVRPGFALERGEDPASTLLPEQIGASASSIASVASFFDARHASVPRS